MFDILTEGKVGMAMGNFIFFTTPDGDEVKVEYSFGYILDDAGNVESTFTTLPCLMLHNNKVDYI